MSFKTRRITGLSLLVAGVLLFAVKTVWGYFPLPDLPAPEEYGNVLISQNSIKNNVKPVSFSHWVHRRMYTCRVCHFELEFAMEANGTGITEKDNREGRFCGACHNGVDLFGTKKEEECVYCHNGDIRASADWFRELDKFPSSDHGNMINWTETWKKGLINPKNELTIPAFKNLAFSEDLTIEGDWARVPPSVFPHGEHIKWLDCNLCHPVLFNIKKKFTQGFKMSTNIEGNFCGLCHMKVAFPLAECNRCHPAMGKKIYKQPRGLRGGDDEQ
jgi:c(7)-type cytochrome triheme protein